MKNYTLWNFKTSCKIFWNSAYVEIKKDGNAITKAEIVNDQKLIDNIKYLLILDYTYDKKYDHVKKIHDNWLDRGKARETFSNSKEYIEIEKEKSDLLKRY